MNCSNVHKCKVPKKVVFIKGEYQIMECTNCKLRYTDPRMPFQEHIETVYGDDYFFGGEDGYPDYFEEKNNLIKQGERYAGIIKKYASPGHLLDIGSAAGFLMQGFANCGWKVSGIEPNKTMSDYGKKELNLDIVHDSFESHNFDQTFELVTMVQVIGHFYDLVSAMDKVYNIVKPEGYVLVESWDMESLYAKLLGKNWHEYSPPSVLNWFSRSTLERCFNDHGFEHVKSGLPNKKISINHALTLFEHKYPELKFGTRFIEKIIGKRTISFTYPPLDVFWSLFKRV